jgi:hypothetical protein
MCGHALPRRRWVCLLGLTLLAGCNLADRQPRPRVAQPVNCRACCARRGPVPCGPCGASFCPCPRAELTGLLPVPEADHAEIAAASASEKADADQPELAAQTPPLSVAAVLQLACCGPEDPCASAGISPCSPPSPEQPRKGAAAPSGEAAARTPPGCVAAVLESASGSPCAAPCLESAPCAPCPPCPPCGPRLPEPAPAPPAASLSFEGIEEPDRLPPFELPGQPVGKGQPLPEPAAKRRSFVDLTAAPCFAHAPDYSWVSGQVEHCRIRKEWRLRYASVDETDRFGGRLTLIENEHLSYLTDGQYVRVAGHLITNDESDRGRAFYRIESFREVQTPTAASPPAAD